MKYLTDELIKSSNLMNFVSKIGILPRPDKMHRRAGNTFQTYRDLKNDSHVWSCIQSRKSGTLNLDYFIDAAYSNSEIVEFIKEIFDDLDISSLISSILDTSLYGFQVQEIIWKNDKNGNIIPDKIISKPHELFFIDNSNEILYKPEPLKDAMKLPDYKFLISRYEADSINPYGTGLLSKCYWYVVFKNSALRFWVNYMEKYGMPLVIGQINRGTDASEMNQLAELLAAMTDNTSIVTPNDINIEIKEPVRNSSIELFKELIKLCNNEISKTILSETLTTELESGSFAAAQTHFRVRREVISADSKLVENTVNQLIYYAVKINFGDLAYPKFRFVINDSDNLNKIDRDTKLVAAGVKFSKEYWMRTYGISDGDFSI